MPFKFGFRKRIKIAPGVNVNLSKSGAGLSVGGKRARVTTGPKGTRVRAGSGPVRYEKQITKGKRKKWFFF